MPDLLFREQQRFQQKRILILTALLPAGMTLLAIWQAGLGHSWGRQPMSNASVVGWSIFLWLIYLRLITVRLITEVRPGELRIALRGLWRATRIALTDVDSVRVVTFDPAADWGGYGIRQTSRGKAFIAGGRDGVELRMKDGSVALVGSRRANELASAIGRAEIRAG